MSTIAEATPTTIAGSGALLAHLRRTGSATVSELAEVAGVARSTVVQRLDLLTARHLVERVPPAPGTRGRPAAQYRADGTGAVVLAAQVGFSGARVAVVDLSGTVLADDLVPVQLEDGPAALAAALVRGFGGVRSIADVAGRPVAGCGIGMPADVELRRLGGHDADWDDEVLRSAVADAVDAPVVLDIDVNLMALAEQRGSWPDAEVFVCVKVGTLIDAAVVVRGEPIRGEHGLAGALGHLRVPGATGSCSCGGVGCLDTVASGAALVETLRAAGREVSRTADVVALARSGDAVATASVREAGRHIGTALAAPVTLLAPRAIGFWGYLTEADAALFAGIREGLYSAALPASTAHLVIARTALGDLAGVRGAAGRVLDTVLAPAAVDRVLASGTWRP